MRLLDWLLQRQPDKYGRSGLWPKVRAEHLRREPTCAACGRSKDLEVHHILPYHEHPELELDDGKDGTGKDGNLISLCRDPCHFYLGHLMNFAGRSNPHIREDAARYLQRIKEASK